MCEGPTEVGALSRWWGDTTSISLRDPEAANIPVISVGGDSGFGAYIRYLDAFGIPWAIVADGPALRRNSHLAKQLRTLRRLPDRPPGDDDDFAQWRRYWQRADVLTVAEQFGDDGKKGGEFEEFLCRVDQDLLVQAGAAVGEKNKPLVGAYFATEHPKPPAETLELYKKIARRFPHVVKLDQSTPATKRSKRS